MSVPSTIRAVCGLARLTLSSNSLLKPYLSKPISRIRVAKRRSSKKIRKGKPILGARKLHNVKNEPNVTMRNSSQLALRSIITALILPVSWLGLPETVIYHDFTSFHGFPISLSKVIFNALEPIIH